MVKLPSKTEKKVLKQAKVPVTLWKAVDEERQARGLKICDVFKYGFEAFIAESNPKKAKEMGILVSK